MEMFQLIGFKSITAWSVPPEYSRQTFQIWALSAGDWSCGPYAGCRTSPPSVRLWACQGGSWQSAGDSCTGWGRGRHWGRRRSGVGAEARNQGVPGVRWEPQRDPQALGPRCRVSGSTRKLGTTQGWLNMRHFNPFFLVFETKSIKSDMELRRY